MIPRPYDRHVSDYALVENLNFALGFSASEAGNIILKSPWIAPLIDNILFGEDAALPEVVGDENSTLRCLLEMDLDELRHLSRITAVLVQSPSLLKSADGAFLRTVVQFANAPGILDFVYDFTPPRIVSLPLVKTVDLTVLPRVAEKASSLLVGVFPEPYLQRFAFRFPRSDLPAPIGLKEASPDAIGFAELTRKALQVFREVKDAETTAG